MLKVTPKAIDALKEALAKMDDPGSSLRVVVQGYG